MIGYDLGQGWRPADQQDDVRDCIAYWDAKTRTWSRWVRDVSVPPLPTAPYTVIRVEWVLHESEQNKPVADRLWLLEGGNWCDKNGQWFQAANVLKQITSFEVLSEPRAITAKAVLDRMHEKSGYSVTLGITLAKLAREFGVEL